MRTPHHSTLGAHTNATRERVSPSTHHPSRSPLPPPPPSPELAQPHPSKGIRLAHHGRRLIAFVARIKDDEGDNAHVIVFSTEDPSFQSGYSFSHSLYVYKYDLSHMFECPDFFTLKQGGEHYLKVSTMPSHRDYIIYGSYELDTTSRQYVFVEDPQRSFTFIDYGPFYASKTFHDPILNRRTIWGWTNDELSDKQIIDMRGITVTETPKLRTGSGPEQCFVGVTCDS